MVAGEQDFSIQNIAEDATQHSVKHVSNDFVLEQLWLVRLNGGADALDSIERR